MLAQRVRGRKVIPLGITISDRKRPIFQWYRNFCRFGNEYFPGEELDTRDLHLLFNATQESYQHLKKHGIKINGTNLLRETSQRMGALGFKVRGVQ
jgi:hypothetical protein